MSRGTKRERKSAAVMTKLEKPIRVVTLKAKEQGTWLAPDRVIAVPASDPRFEDVDDPGERTRKELERFFLTSVDMTGKVVRVTGWRGAKVASRLIDESARNARKKR